MIYEFPWLTLKACMLVVGFLLVAVHAVALAQVGKGIAWLRAFPRNREAGILLTAIAAGWFFAMVKFMDLGEFTPWKNAVLVFTPVSAVLMMVYVRDFLAVRALGTLALLAAEPLLEAAWMRPELVKLLLVVLCFVWVVLGLFWVGMPFTLRNQITWLTASESRWRAAALAGLAYGVLLVAGGLLLAGA